MSTTQANTADGAVRLYVWDINTLTWIPWDGAGGGSGPGGGLTDAELRATPVPVSGTFFQVTQPVSIAAAVPVTDNGGSITVDGTFWQATQPISAAALPLPSGAATAALQTQPGVDIGDVTVNNPSIAVTQSGTWDEVGINDSGNSLTVDAPVATPVFVRLSDGAAAISTLPISAASLPAHDVTQATATNLKTQAEAYQGGTAVSTTNPLHTDDYDPEYGFAWGSTSLRDRLTVQRYTVLSDSIADGLAKFWTFTTSNGGGITPTGGEGLVETSADALGVAQMSSTAPAYFPGQVAWLNSAIRLGDTGSVGNVRRWGPFTVSGTTPQDGFYYELSGTTLNAVAVKAGTPTAVASTSWTKFATAPFTLDTNYHSFEVRWTANGANFYIDNILRHSVSGGGTSITATLNFPITIQSINTSGATNRLIAVRNIGLGRFGQPDTLTSAGPLSVAKASNTKSADGDVGIPAYTMRQDIPMRTTSADGNYGPTKTDKDGRVWMASDTLGRQLDRVTMLLEAMTIEARIQNDILAAGLNYRDSLDQYRNDARLLTTVNQG